MNILDRTLVIKSPIPPEDIKVLWIDMSTDPKSIHLWNANTGAWEPLGDGKSVMYIEQSLSSEEAAQARKNIGAIGMSKMSENSGILTYDGGKTLFPKTEVQHVRNAVAIGGRISDCIVLQDGENYVNPQTKADYVKYEETNLKASVDSIFTSLQDLNSRLSALEEK